MRKPPRAASRASRNGADAKNDLSAGTPLRRASDGRDLLSTIEAAVRRLRARRAAVPSVGLVLGSGLGPLAEALEQEMIVPFEEIPGFVPTTVLGHAGRLIFGRLSGRPVAVLQGRLHYYEGHSMEQVTFPYRVLKKLGVRTLLLTSSVGGISPRLGVGDVVAVKDHINFMGVNALRGRHSPEFGARFPDMTEPYSPALRRLARGVARRLGFPLKEAVYCAVSGPCYETPAEIRMFRKWGADVVGMSVVPEAVVSRQEGLDVLALACVTNKAAGRSDGPLHHGEVMEQARRAGGRLASLLAGIVSSLPAQPFPPQSASAAPRP